MVRKRRLVLMLSPIIAILACNLPSSVMKRLTGDVEVTAVTTAVGTPNGLATTKSIGSAGGSLATPDGRLTLKIPQNALSSLVNVTIQPITDQSPGGLGKAYRLEPNGQTFGTPVEVSFRYDDKDLEGTSPEALDVAYQDAGGFWRVFQSVDRDQANKTLTVATTHFTDYTAVTRFQLVPNHAVVRVGKSVELVVNSCGRRDFFDKLFKLSGPCLPVSTATAAVNWTVNGTSGNSTFGTVTDSVKEAQAGGTYTAPVKKPEPNVVIVRTDVQYKFYRSNSDVWAFALITIVDRGYRASGKIFETVLSGDICDLEKPFAIKTNNPFNTDFKCVPSSPTKGTCTVSETKWGGGGGGPYTITGTDTLKTGIELDFSGKATIRGAGTSTGGGPIHIDLTPLESNECGGG